MKTVLTTIVTILSLAGGLAASSPSEGNCADILLVDYFAIQEALAADSLDTAKTAAKQLLAAHKQNPCAKAVGESTQALLDAKSMAEARAAFKAISDSIIPLVEKNGASGETHLVHCPMAFGFTGASWLQKDKRVANPYFGSEMFGCGHVQQTFGQSRSQE